MDSSFLLETVAAATGFFTLLGTILFMVYRKFKDHRENKENDSSSSTQPSPSPPLSSLSLTRKYDVFPSFRGEDVRKDFLSHIQKEFQRQGITPFVDNNIKRGESIGPELIRAIRGSKIAIILLSKNYASSSWCLDELVEIIKCKEEMGQTVIVIFYKVDPSLVKKLTGDFGKVFRNTCKGKERENIERWREAFKKVATIAGYDSRKWDNESAMIEKIVSDISEMLNHSTPSRDFDDLIGMGDHMEKMKPLLDIDSDEMRTIGIWGPPGVGKTTIARSLYNQHSDKFQLSVFMESIKTAYTIPACSDDYYEKLQLQQRFLSQITNQENVQIPHLGVAQERLNDKKVLVVIDDVNQSVQVDALAKENDWLGPGSRIIITTQDRGILRAHGIEHIYEVDYPNYEEALQIFCMHAFGQKSTYDGFEELAQQVTTLSGRLPLGLKVMGSYFRGMTKQEWTMALPRVRTHLDGKIESILKLSYDALCDVDKSLFLHLACSFHNDDTELVEQQLGKKFSDLRQGLHVLAEKSLIHMDLRLIRMHVLLAQLGREIVRKQSIHEPGQRQFLVDATDIREVLTDDTGSRSVIGIDFDFNTMEKELDISEKAFRGMSNLQFIRIYGDLFSRHGVYYFGGRGHRVSLDYDSKLHFPRGLDYLPGKLSKLEKLWEGIQPLRNLEWLDLTCSRNLKELPDLSTATNLQRLSIERCSSLVKLPSSIGEATNLKKINLRECLSLVELPSSFGNLTNLQELDLRECSSLVELPTSFGNLANVESLEFYECSSLVKLPSTFGNLTNLRVLGLRECSSMVELPSSFGNLTNLQVLNLRKCSTLVELPSSFVNLTNLENLDLRDCSSLLPSSFGNVTYLKRLKFYKC
ncbi:Toll/interleukin-1 receptor homology (TIR) domain [Arabidopsis suecica]|uniref:ADP-ribosyl cyclase/cyclic ADP-ribose hydrolase n=1 Tax=Arabidopsis suecica TaxID=45249 RepID=A0A8T2F3I1_ARASU|nr:Toll/interleukin-1 receptor homology (TIR) domain [Arabidopsis suecica]